LYTGSNADVIEAEMMAIIEEPVIEYKTSGYHISEPLSISDFIGAPTLNWSAITPTGTGVVVKTGISESALTQPETWVTQTNGQPVSNMPEDYDGKYLWCKQELSTSDSTVTPTLESLSISYEYKTGALVFGLQLATNVSKISAVRGWVPVNGTETTDQGLVIGYIKSDGTVWYRTYAIQVGGGQAWESERQITEFTKTAVNISTFRTNDFRVGFVVQNSDSTVELLVTNRNWAGMSVVAETLSATVGYENVYLDLTEMERTWINVYPRETVKAGELDNKFIFNIYDNGDVPVTYTITATSGYITGDRKFVVEFNYPVYCWKPEKINHIITTPNIVDTIIDGNKIYFTTDTDFTEDELVQGISAIVGGGLLIGPTIDKRTEVYLGATVTIRGIVAPHTETLSPSLSISASLNMTELIKYSYVVHPQETVSADIEISSVSLTLTDLSTTPI
jgi:phenolic acid decarboxylase